MTSILLIAVSAGLLVLLVKIFSRSASVSVTASTPSIPVPSASHAPSSALREVLFGDVPLDQWHGNHSTLLPWTLFAQAQKQVVAGQAAEAVSTLHQVLAMPGQESRQYLQAWNALRQLGVAPSPAEAKSVLGVVVEVGMPGGLDTLAAYADHTARFFHYAGQMVIWEHPSDLLDSLIDQLLHSASAIVNQIGPWDKARPGPPGEGQMRLLFLTPSGLHFGQGGVNVLSADPLARETIAIATQLMQRLMELPRQK